jgi:hypothetical protein
MSKKSYIYLSVILIPLLISACVFSVVRGSGEISSEMREVQNFDRVELSGVGTLYIAQGDEETLRIEAEDNVLPKIETRVRDNILEIGFGDRDWSKIVQPTEPIKFFLTVKEIEGLSISGAGKVIAESIESTSLDINSSGAGDIAIDHLETKDLSVSLSGAGNCVLGGEVVNQSISISGAGNYQARDLQSQVTSIAVSGMGSVEVWAEDTLDIAISGAGSVKYYGRPSISQDISGAGDIQSLGER